MNDTQYENKSISVRKQMENYLGHIFDKNIGTRNRTTGKIMTPTETIKLKELEEKIPTKNIDDKRLDPSFVSKTTRHD
jgi:hypothetical protein